MKVLFMGTPDLAAVVLEEIIRAGHEVAGVVTQPDKAKGRGGKVSFSPVKETALKHNLDIYQPVRVRNPEFLRTVRSINPEVIVVAAFGQILPRELLDIPPYGCINVHASLLPKYRGAAPIQAAIINGDKETGVTIMHMDAGIDTGDMILWESVPIADDETGGSLHDKLAGLGARLLVEALKQLKEGTAKRIPQDNSRASYVKMMDKEMGNIDFSKPAVEIERLIRGLNPWPSAYTRLDGKILKIWKAKVVENPEGGKPGEVVKVDKNTFTVMTGEGALEILELQLEGKKRLGCDAFLRGYPVKKGLVLG
ncbi:MAG: methionyl-tRNA formyltransferase [Clostridiales bacterium]|nr:methionyl-tRNA formyltransferase [Clostridiales bacterium]